MTRNVLPFAASQSCTNPSSSQTGEKFALRSPSLAAIPAAAPPRDAQRDAFDKYDTNHSGELDHDVETSGATIEEVIEETTVESNAIMDAMEEAIEEHQADIEAIEEALAMPCASTFC